ncbi:hypothetical protein H5398_08500 [Tessaracoccus sp. MC1679]|uniref:hypothetical protein n=1 Tax=Tessaracoccus sp. MC1679 TaxID=2760313 RepID=UPI00160399AA|nr:hypothetical protein [Tessaracoccus sp. MC1679]MBB1516005.1 hypothetical protein [Tessaracoccus sp. MC1679]
MTPEIVRLMKASDADALTSSEIQMRYAEFKAILRRASAGTLRGDEWKPVSRDPLLWELRWSWDGSHLRGYFHEPPLEPDSTILAKVHEKQIVQGDDRATKQHQNAAIDTAGTRIRRCQTHRWGLGFSKPLF